MENDGLVSETTLDPHTAGAVFSPDRRYRYRLWRTLRLDPRRLVFLMLNPSVAGATDDDMTIRKCLGFAARLGTFGIVDVVNAYGFIATDPADLWAAKDPIGPRNDEAVLDCLQRVAFVPESFVVAAWGATGISRSRESDLIAIARRAGVKEIHCLGRTREGYPRHPSRIAYSTPLSSWWKP